LTHRRLLTTPCFLTWMLIASTMILQSEFEMLHRRSAHTALSHTVKEALLHSTSAASIGPPWTTLMVAAAFKRLRRRFRASRLRDFSPNLAKRLVFCVAVTMTSRTTALGFGSGQDGLIHYCNLAANVVLGWPNDGISHSIPMFMRHFYLF
jgi:hypothetical protein